MRNERLQTRSPGALFSDKGKKYHDQEKGLKVFLYIKKTKLILSLKENEDYSKILQLITYIGNKGHKNLREQRIGGRSGISLDIKPRT